MKKAIIIGVACLTAGIGLAGCAGSNEQPTEATTTAETTTVEETTTTTAAETTTTTQETTTTTQETTTTTEAPTTVAEPTTELIDVTGGIAKNCTLKGTVVYHKDNYNDGTGEIEPFVGLKLDSPVQATLETGDTKSIDEVQLGVGSYSGSLSDYEGENITVKGDVFGSHTSHHFTSIIMTVNEVL